MICRQPIYYWEDRNFLSDVDRFSVCMGTMVAAAVAMVVAAAVTVPNSLSFYGCISGGAAFGGLSTIAAQKIVIKVKYPANDYRKGWVDPKIFTPTEEEVRKILQKKFPGNVNRAEAYADLCRKGVCYGIVATLLEIVEGNPSIKSKELLEKLGTSKRQVLEHQIQSFVGPKSSPKGKHCLVTTIDLKKYYHLIFVQEEEKFRFYDSYDCLCGLYEFTNKSQLNTYLQKHVEKF